ncbi:MAG TPA: hypothetical protein VFF06_15655 [Polyangia bacterium]|nr:hypothetical protein [Polyangia bacterium]
MKRRDFFRTAASAAAACAWPALVRRAFADASCDPSSGKPGVELAAAYRRAQRAGKPLVVFVVPAADGEKYDRGHAFGEFLNNAADAEMAPLATAEVVCATMAELERLVPNAGKGEPLVMVVGTDRAPAPIARFADALPKWEWRDDDAKADAIIDRRIALVGEWLSQQLPLPANADVAQLAARAKADLRVQPPSGARWARSSGCGTVIEGVDHRASMACGMGHTPDKSRRFLYLFAIVGR